MGCGKWGFGKRIWGICGIWRESFSSLLIASRLGGLLCCLWRQRRWISHLHFPRLYDAFSFSKVDPDSGWVDGRAFSTSVDGGSLVLLRCSISGMGRLVSVRSVVAFFFLLAVVGSIHTFLSSA